MQGVKDWMIVCLKGQETGEEREQMTCVKDWVTFCLNRETGRKERTLRVIELDSDFTPPRSRLGIRPRFHLDSVKAEEYKV